MSTMRSSTVTVVEQIEKLAVERAVVVLREQVRALPVNDEDGLWVKTQVERMLNEAMTTRSAPGSGGADDPALPANSGVEQTAAAERSTAPRGEPAG